MDSTRNIDRREPSRAAPGGRLMLRMNATLFYSVGAACLLEATATVRAKRLLATLGAGTVLGQWIETAWLPEKLERARALQAYAVAIWPEIDWPVACEELQSALLSSRGASFDGGCAHEALAQCVGATQASVFYGCMSAWAEDAYFRELAHRSSTAEKASFRRFKEAFALSQRQERLGIAREFRVALACVRSARDTTVRAAFEILKGYWGGTPPFPDVTYEEFLLRASRIARRGGVLAWPHRLLLRPWFSQPALRAVAIPERMRSSPRVSPPRGSPASGAWARSGTRGMTLAPEAHTALS
jgi:hypothetical protein